MNAAVPKQRHDMVIGEGEPTFGSTTTLPPMEGMDRISGNFNGIHWLQCRW